MVCRSLSAANERMRIARAHERWVPLMEAARAKLGPGARWDSNCQWFVADVAFSPTLTDAQKSEHAGKQCFIDCRQVGLPREPLMIETVLARLGV